jgi:preprotein translocase subunit SecD
MVALDTTGARQLAELTRQHVGHKVAFVLDGTVKSAPIVMSPITGGRLMITMGGNPRATEEARLLAIALKSGSLPAPLIKSSVHPVKR